MKLATLLSTTWLLYIARCTNADICTRCKCPNTTLTQYIDCARLNLSNLPKTNEWPLSLTNDTSKHVLTIIDFEYNDIDSVEQFPELFTIVGLCLRHNKINKIAVAAFLNLKHLKKLDLSHNVLTSDVIRADVFRGSFDNDRYEPLNIETLDLGYNQIHSISAKAFEHLPELIELHLNNNPLKIIDSPTELALGTINRLEILNLGYTELSSLPDGLMHSLKGLKELFLQGNYFEKIPEDLAAVGSTLERLNFNDNTMTSLDGNSFLGLGKVIELNISGCQNLSEIRPATFSQLYSLQVLYLNFNFKLAYFDTDAFRELIQRWPIKQIHLKHNALTDLSRDLLPWDELDILDIQENPWRCDCELNWVATELLPKMIKFYPAYTSEIRCAEPQWLRGLQMSSVSTNSTCSVTGSHTIHVMIYPLHMFVMIIIILTTIVFLAAMIMLLKKEVWEKRRNFVTARNVKYSRQDDEEEVFSI